jgi:hypothetical protein
MKAFFLALYLGLGTLAAQAQTLSVSVIEDHIYESPSALDAYNNATTLTNNTASGINIGAKVDGSGIAAQHEFAICFGANCYNRGLTPAPDPQAIGANQAYSDFKLYCYPNGSAGTSNIRVTWYLWNNPNDSVDYTFKFTFSTTSVADFLSQGNVGLAAPSPNPAGATAVFTYQLPAGVQAGDIEVWDLNGREVARIPVSATDNQVGVATATWPTGVYTLRLVSGAAVLGTQKLVIQH